MSEGGLKGLGHTSHAIHTTVHGLQKETNPGKGAMMGGIGGACSASGALALFGLALTPVGWVVALGAGAAAGAAYVASKKK